MKVSLEVFGTELWALLVFMAQASVRALPLLLISIPLAVLLRLSGGADKVRQFIGGRPIVGIFLATLVGAVSPLCSCTVIPVVYSLLTAGVPLAAVMSFWVASPSMDPEIFFLSVATLGWPLAIWRLVSTFVLSLSAGFITYALTKAGFFNDGILRQNPSLKQIGFGEVFKKLTLKRGIFGATQGRVGGPSLDKQRKIGLGQLVPDSACACAEPSVKLVSPSSNDWLAQTGASLTSNAGATRAVNLLAARNLTLLKLASQEPEAGLSSGGANQGACCSTKQAIQEKRFSFKRIGKESLEAFLFVGKFLVLAFLLEALIIRYLPAELVASWLGTSGFGAVFVAALVGIPLYTSNWASLGIMGGLMAKGMAGSAVLAFLIAGPTTTLPAMSAVFGIAKWRVFLVYLSFSFLGALAVGGIHSFVSFLFFG